MDSRPTILDRFRIDGPAEAVTGAGRGIGAGAALAARTESELADRPRTHFAYRKGRLW